MNYDHKSIDLSHDMFYNGYGKPEIGGTYGHLGCPHYEEQNIKGWINHPESWLWDYPWGKHPAECHCGWLPTLCQWMILCATYVARSVEL